MPCTVRLDDQPSSYHSLAASWRWVRSCRMPRTCEVNAAFRFGNAGGNKNIAFLYIRSAGVCCSLLFPRKNHLRVRILGSRFGLPHREKTLADQNK